MERSVELELLPACREYGIGVMPYSPLNSGLLGGVRSKGKQTAARSVSSRATDGLSRNRAQITRYEQLCREIGHPPAAVAQSWLLHQPGVNAVIVGARTMNTSTTDGPPLRPLCPNPSWPSWMRSFPARARRRRRTHGDRLLAPIPPLIQPIDRRQDRRVQARSRGRPSRNRTPDGAFSGAPGIDVGLRSVGLRE